MNKRPYRCPAPQPSIEQLRECFAADFDAGRLIWLRRPIDHFVSHHAYLAFNAKHCGREALTNAHPMGYRAGHLTFAGKRFSVRRCRILWAMYHGEWPSLEIGHRNYDFGDDRISNLRLQTESQKAAAARWNLGSSGARGVHLDARGNFVATICFGKRSHYLGTHYSLEDAVRARNAAALKLHGDFVRLSTLPTV